MIYELTEPQYNKIVRFWKYINAIEEQLHNHKKTIYAYLGYTNLYNNEINWNSHDVMRAENDLLEQDEISVHSSELLSKLDYYNNEYEKYINSIGFELGDRLQSETLFQLLNMGIAIDDY